MFFENLIQDYGLSVAQRLPTFFGGFAVILTALAVWFVASLREYSSTEQASALLKPLMIGLAFLGIFFFSYDLYTAEQAYCEELYRESGFFSEYSLRECWKIVDCESSLFGDYCLPKGFPP